MAKTAKKILLIDLDDSRRTSRIALLEQAGYHVSLRTDHVQAAELNQEGTYDLVVVALHRNSELATEYSDRLAILKPKLPILLLTDFGVLTPEGTLSRSIKAGVPREIMAEIATMLEGSAHIREMSKDAAPPS
jgi:DNA-binding NtrC family response regulator